MRWPDRVRLGGAATTLTILALALLATPAAVLAATPSPTAATVGDPRSSGGGPGLVGDPLWAIGLVVLIAILALGATLVYVRATASRRSDPGR